MPELSLSLYLHLHHSVVGVLYTLQGFLNSWKQVNDLLFADQDLAVGKSQHGADVNIQHCGSLKYQMSRERLKGISPRVLDSYLRCVYRSLRTLSWFWTVWMMAFTISELSLLTSGSGAEREDKSNYWSHTSQLSSKKSNTFVKVMSWQNILNVSYFYISSSVACRAQSPFLHCNEINKSHFKSSNLPPT